MCWWCPLSAMFVSEELNAQCFNVKQMATTASQTISTLSIWSSTGWWGWKIRKLKHWNKIVGEMDNWNRHNQNCIVVYIKEIHIVHTFLWINSQHNKWAVELTYRGDASVSCEHWIWWKLENWSFPGLSEANLCVLEPRAFSAKARNFGQGFPKLDRFSHSAHHPSSYPISSSLTQVHCKLSFLPLRWHI